MYIAFWCVEYISIFYVREIFGKLFLFLRYFQLRVVSATQKISGSRCLSSQVITVLVFGRFCLKTLVLQILVVKTSLKFATTFFSELEILSSLHCHNSFHKSVCTKYYILCYSRLKRLFLRTHGILSFFGNVSVRSLMYESSH